jgi:hypothetical protein
MCCSGGDVGMIEGGGIVSSSCRKALSNVASWLIGMLSALE